MKTKMISFEKLFLANFGSTSVGLFSSIAGARCSEHLQCMFFFVDHIIRKRHRS